MSANICLIVAHSRNRVIGRDGDLPWHLSEDLKFFKAKTMGKPIIMGRKTFESIGKALPGRTSIVVSRDTEFMSEGVLTVSAVEEAIEVGRDIAHMQDQEEVMVIGGAQIYGQALGLADRIYLTEVDAEVDGDVFFPKLEGLWEEVERSEVQVDEKSGVAFSWVTLNRTQ